MSAPHFNILTQHELTIDLSRVAMENILMAMAAFGDRTDWSPEVSCELDNFRNMLQNLLERSEPENLDLVGG